MSNCRGLSPKECLYGGYVLINLSKNTLYKKLTYTQFMIHALFYRVIIGELVDYTVKYID